MRTFCTNGECTQSESRNNHLTRSLDYGESGQGPVVNRTGESFSVSEFSAVVLLGNSLHSGRGRLFKHTLFDLVLHVIIGDVPARASQICYADLEVRECLCPSEDTKGYGP